MIFYYLDACLSTDGRQPRTYRHLRGFTALNMYGVVDENDFDLWEANR